MINVDFIIDLSLIRRQDDSIWMFVDKVTKFEKFFPIKSTNSEDEYTNLYFNKLVSLQGVPFSIISNKGPMFTSTFLKSFYKGIGNHVNLCTTFHPQIIGKAECTIQTYEEILRACVINFESGRAYQSPIILYVYNNSYNSSIEMSPCEVSYRR